MKEHAIPQDITGYKFHIVGNMTLKQFAETAIGFVLAFFVYKTNLYAPVKFSLMAFFAAFGAALAFLPIEERPLDHWFITFFTILYKPTKFYWKKRSKVPEAFTYESTQNVKNQVDTVDLTPQRRQRISEYLQSVKDVKEEDQEEIYYRQRSSQLLAIFDDHSIKINYDRTKKIKQKPNLKVQVRSLIGTEEELVQEEEANQTISQDQTKNGSLSLPEIEIVLEKQTEEYDPLIKEVVATEEAATEIEIPELEEVKVEDVYKQEQEAMGSDVAEQNKQTKEEQEETIYVETTVDNDSEDNSETTAVTINKDLPFPTKPSKPNKLVGMTLTQSSDLINNAIITLRDSNGSPITAVRSNALGQFFVTSQLKNGKYNIEVKKTGFSFFPISINLEGKTVDPLEIRSIE
jgi:hypothetical protein